MKAYFIFYGKQGSEIGMPDIYYYRTLADAKNHMRTLDFYYDKEAKLWFNNDTFAWAQIISLKPAPIYEK